MKMKQKDIYEYIPLKNTRVFRYRAINENNIDAVKNNYLWFSDFYAQNDPFDGTTEYIWDKEDDKKIYDEIKDNYPEIFKLGNNVLTTVLSKIPRGYSDKNPALISCFSYKYDNILLWSHYAEGHRGFCQVFKCKTNGIVELLEIDPDSISQKKEKMLFYEKYLQLLPVQYQKKRGEPLHSSKINTEEGKKILFNNTRIKSDAWEYEKELRGIVYDNCLSNANKVFYPENSLYGIILGCKIDEEHEKLLTTICKEKKCHLSKMQEVVGDFAIKEIKII